jgi:putative PIG3 family NAD(P)H quinone oxidoreductase
MITALAVQVPSPGGPEALVLARQPVPSPAVGQVLIEVHAAGVNRADCKQRAGDYPMPPEAPNVPGLEVSGIVQAVGAGVAGWKPGDRVCALVVGGGYAEYCIAPAAQCLPVPAGVDLVEAAALPEALFTVWTSLFEHAALRPGDVALIHGGASGIGTMAIQLAAALGSRPVATAGSAERAELCRNLGAELAIDYRKQDFVDEVLRHTGGRGVDVVLDMVGGPYAARNLKALAPYGRLCYIAGDAGPEATFNIREIMLKRIVVTGSTLRHRSVEDKGRIAGILRRVVWPLLERGRIKPVVDHVVPLAEVRDAHVRMESGKVAGKIVLRVRG